MKDLSGCVIRSNGKYEPVIWEHLLIKLKGDLYDSICLNGFNVGCIRVSELDGYDIIPPMEHFESLDEFITDLIDGISRLGGEFKRVD